MKEEKYVRFILFGTEKTQMTSKKGCQGHWVAVNKDCLSHCIGKVQQTERHTDFRVEDKAIRRNTECNWKYRYNSK